MSEWLERPVLWASENIDRYKLWNYEADMSRYNEAIRMRTAKALNERFDAVYSNSSFVNRKLEQLYKDFGNRLLNLENYIIDKEINRILPNLVVASPDIKITTFRDYNIPILEINDNYLSGCLNTLNQIYYCKLEIFFLVKYNGFFYKYSNTISPLDYILSDLEKWKPRYDYDAEKIHGSTYYFFSENGIHYFNKIEEKYSRYGEKLNLLVPIEKCEIVNNYTKSLLEKIRVSSEIYQVLSEKIVKKNKNKKHTFTLNDKKHIISLGMNVNGCDENLPIIIIENGQDVFRGNYYVDYIDSDIKVIDYVKEIITKLNTTI
jgi:YHS domain-containing protein